MTHVRTTGKKPRHRASDCRKGRHDYSPAQNIGAGIVRQVCARCGAVTIDLSQTERAPEPESEGHRVRSPNP